MSVFWSRIYISRYSYTL